MPPAGIGRRFAGVNIMGLIEVPRGRRIGLGDAKWAEGYPEGYPMTRKARKCCLMHIMHRQVPLQRWHSGLHRSTQPTTTISAATTSSTIPISGSSRINAILFL
jgi:hypothetical protein